MDSRGNFYASDAVKAEIAQRLGAQMAEQVRPPPAPAGSIEVEDKDIAAALLGMNRRKRRAFFAERRRGRSEADAFAAIQED